MGCEGIHVRCCNALILEYYVFQRNLDVNSFQMEELRHHLDYFTKDFTSFLDAIIVENEYGEFSYLQEIIVTFTVSERSIRSRSP